MYCFQKGHTISRCHLVSYDERKGSVKKIGKNFMLPDSSIIPEDPSRPIKDFVDDYSQIQAPKLIPTAMDNMLCSTAIAGTFRKEYSPEEPLAPAHSIQEGKAQCQEELSHFIPFQCVTLSINGHSCKGFLNPGSEFNLIPEEQAHQMGLEIEKDSLSSKSLENEYNMTIYFGIAQGLLSIRKTSNHSVFLVGNKPGQLILEKQFLQDFSATLFLGSDLPSISYPDTTSFTKYPFGISGNILGIFGISSNTFF
jgi:hypothetical protein